MKVVTFLMALLMSLSMTASLFAAENKGKNDVDLIFQSASIVEPTPEADLVFQSPVTAQPLELALLSEEEMAETEGAWFNVVTAVVSVATQYIKDPDSSPEQLLAAAVVGGLTGGAVQ